MFLAVSYAEFYKNNKVTQNLAPACFPLTICRADLKSGRQVRVWLLSDATFNQEHGSKRGINGRSRTSASSSTILFLIE